MGDWCRSRIFDRQSLINLAKNGTSIIVLSQDLDELIEITHRISVIYDGSLSESFITKEIDITKLGLLMGGKNWLIFSLT